MERSTPAEAGQSSLPLSHVAVLDLSSGIAGGYCTKILADVGAEVVKLETQHGDPLRRWTWGGPTPAGQDGALFEFLSCSKRSVSAEVGSDAFVRTAHDLAGDADVIVWSPAEHLSDPRLAPAALLDVAPMATVVAITPFGLEGPWVGRACTEFTLQAWGGGPGQRGHPTRPPLFAGSREGEWSAGSAAALGALASLLRVDRPAGEIVDVSVLESLVFTHTWGVVTYRSFLGAPIRPNRYGCVPGIEPAVDGWVGFMVVTGQQWQDFCSMIGREDWAADENLSTLDGREARRDEFRAGLLEWTKDRTVAEIVELSSLFRVPAVPVGNGANVVDCDHFEAIGAIVPSPNGQGFQPAPPFKLHGTGLRSPSPSPALGSDNDRPAFSERLASAGVRRPVARPTTAPRLPFEGLRICDLTAFVAGPVVSHIMAMLGAEVIHVESIQRPDLMRYRSIRKMGEPDWWEWSPQFHASNLNKYGVTINLTDPRGVELLHDLIEQSDVVIENWTPRVAENLGLTYDTLRKIREDLIMVRMPAYGLEGPWKNWPGYAQTSEQASGLAWLTGFVDDQPEVPNGECDPIASIHATIGLMAALEHRRRTGEGQLVETPMVLPALNFASEQVLEHSNYGRFLERNGNRGPYACPQGVYLAADVEDDDTRDRWVAIAVETDEQWRRLVEALGSPAWAQNEKYGTQEGRRASEDEIDQQLAAWCDQLTTDQVVSALWDRDVPVAAVARAYEPEANPQLESRDFWEQVVHPLTGNATYHTFPARFSAGPTRFHRFPAPTLGQHDEQILRDRLGLSAAEIEQLGKDRVIGTSPENSDVRW